MDKPNWAYWKNLAHVELKKAIMLSCDIEPGSLDHFTSDRYIRADVRDAQLEIAARLRIALSHIDARTLPLAFQVISVAPAVFRDDRYFVTLKALRSWGERLPEPLSFPKAFPNGAQELFEAEHQRESEPRPHGDWERSDADKSLDVRERTSLLRIIRALDAMAGLPMRGPSTSVEIQLQTLGFDSPKEATIRKAIEEARSLDPDRNPQ